MSSKISFFHSIRTKIILITIIAITVILGAYGVYEINRQQSSLNSEINELSQVTVKRMENNLKLPLWNLDKELISDTVDAEMLTRDIHAIFVLDSNETDLMSGKQRGVNGEVVNATNVLINDDDIVKEESTIIYKDQTVGKVIVYADKRFKQSDLASSIKGLLFTLLLLVISIFIILWFVLSNLLKKPIVALSEVADRISRGDFTVEVDTTRKDEIGVVANSVQRMKLSLNVAMVRLRKLERLRQLVEKKRNPQRNNGK